jgi:hypothetical protein
MVSVMVPAGYMAKRVVKKPDWLRSEGVADILSVSDCISRDFDDYIHYWKHNGFWFFDSPSIISNLAHEHSIDLAGTQLFYYEVYSSEFDGESWKPFAPEPNFPTKVVPPSDGKLEGFDVVTFSCQSSPECSPLACNSMADEIPTNSHCLLRSFEEAEKLVGSGAFNNSEPGPYRIFAVYTVSWPEASAPE